MDGTRFDELVKGISSKRLTRLSAIRGLATGAVAAVTGVSLLVERTAAADNGPKSNPKRKKKTICHCTNSNVATCATKRIRPKSAKKHLKHGCDYPGPCQGRSGCPAAAGGGAQPGVVCNPVSCAAAPTCGTCVSGTCVPGTCPVTCTAEPCSVEEPSVCTSQGGECTCIASTGQCGIPDDTCPADKCSGDYDCNTYVDGCKCRDIDTYTGKGTCGTKSDV